jgi:hypothetical protein
VDTVTTDGRRRAHLLQHVVDAEVLVLGGQRINLVLEQTVLVRHIGEDQRDLAAPTDRPSDGDANVLSAGTLATANPPQRAGGPPYVLSSGLARILLMTWSMGVMPVPPATCGERCQCQALSDDSTPCCPPSLVRTPARARAPCQCAFSCWART